MTRGDDLVAAFRRDLRDEAVDLALAEDFEMRIRFVQQDDRARIGVHVGKDQERLLQATPAGREVQGGAALPVPHRDLPPLLDIAGLVEFDPEQPLYAGNQRSPPVGALGQDTETQIAQHFGRPALAHPHVHRALIEPGLGRGQTGHGRKKGDAQRSGFARDRHPLRRPVVVEPQRPAIERFLVRVVEFQAAGPDPALVDPFDDQVDTHVVGALPPFDTPDVPHMQVAPQMHGARMGDGEQVPPVDRYAGTLFRRALVGPLHVPPLDADIPQRQGLHRRGLPRIVRPDEHDRIPQLDLDFSEAFEIADGEPGEHPVSPA